MKTNSRIGWSIGIVCLALCLSGCIRVRYNSTDDPIYLKASDTIVIKKYSVDSFDRIENRVPCTIVFTQGNQYKVEAEGPNNYVELLRVITKDGTLDIKIDNTNIIGSFKNRITLRITSPNLQAINHHGAGDITLKDSMHVERLSIKSSGVGNICADALTAQQLNIEQKGVGSISLTGKAENASYKLNGVGNLKAKEMVVSNLSVNQKGVGSITCHATHSIQIKSQGVGSVDYYGDPKKTTFIKSGVGSINKK